MANDGLLTGMVFCAFVSAALAGCSASDSGGEVSGPDNTVNPASGGSPGGDTNPAVGGNADPSGVAATGGDTGTGGDGGDCNLTGEVGLEVGLLTPDITLYECDGTPVQFYDLICQAPYTFIYSWAGW